MAWAWNDAIPDGQVIDKAFIEKFWQAYQDRLSTTYPTLAASLTAVAAGDDFTNVNKTGVFPAAGGTFSIYWMQRLFDTTQILFLGITKLASQTDARVYYTNWEGDFATDAGIGNSAVVNGWTRKLPKEVYSTTQTRYWVYTASDADASNPLVANGDYARLRWSGHAGDGNILHRVAGAWVAVSGHGPDVLTGYGYLRAGDYVGAYVFRELMAAFNLMVNTASFDLGSYGIGQGNIMLDSTASYVAWGDATADVDAQWGGATINTAGFVGPGYIASGTESGGSYTAHEMRESATFTDSLVVGMCNVTVQLWCEFTSGFDAWATGGDANVPAGAGFAKIKDQALTPAGGTQTVTQTLGDITASGPWPGAPASGTSYEQGWNVATGCFILRKWTFRQHA